VKKTSKQAMVICCKFNAMSTFTGIVCNLHLRHL